MVYKLVHKHKKEGAESYKAKLAGRPKLKLNSSFVKKVAGIRKYSDYGSEKIHFVLKNAGFGVSQHIIQRILNEQGLTKPCPKLRGQHKYLRYQWPISNYMWHCDWSQYEREWYLAFIDDRSRKIMASGEFRNATEENVIFLLYQAILTNETCPFIILSDKGTQFYNSKRNKKGFLTPSLFEQELNKLGIEFWTSRRNHPQTNGKMEKWFDTMKKRKKRHPEETLQEFVTWYNEWRIHHALDYETPDGVYRKNL